MNLRLIALCNQRQAHKPPLTRAPLFSPAIDQEASVNETHRSF